MTGTWARYANIILGIWLFISAFVWAHGSAQMTNTWICGILAVGFALLTLASPGFRFANMLLGIWLFISAFALPRVSSGTVVNNAIVGALLFLFALVPEVKGGRVGAVPHRRRATV